MFRQALSRNQSMGRIGLLKGAPPRLPTAGKDCLRGSQVPALVGAGLVVENRHGGRHTTRQRRAAATAATISSLPYRRLGCKLRAHRFDAGDPAGDGAADCLRVVFLEEVQPGAEANERAMLQ